MLTIDKNSGYQLLTVDKHGNEDGWLVALEAGGMIPFDIKRFYYIFATSPDFVRGLHAHQKLQQIVICLAGSCDFTVDDGQQRQTFHLHSPTQLLYIKNLVWREFTHFSADCVLGVLASEPYDPTDYIHDYETFLALSKELA